MDSTSSHPSLAEVQRRLNEEYGLLVLDGHAALKREREKSRVPLELFKAALDRVYSRLSLPAPADLRAVDADSYQSRLIHKLAERCCYEKLPACERCTLSDMCPEGQKRLKNLRLDLPLPHLAAHHPPFPI